MSNIKTFVATHFQLMWFIGLAWVLFLMLLGWFARLREPKIIPAEILYQEKWRTGRRLQPFWSKLFFYKNCLHIIFLKDRLIIRPHFPFDIFDWWIGFRVSVRYEQIRECVQKKHFFQDFFEITFQTITGLEKIEFTAKNSAKVLSYCQRNE